MSEAATIEVRVTRIEEDMRENRSSHERMFTRLEVLEKGESANSVRFSQIMETLKEITEDIRSLKGKPAMQWDNLVKIVVAAIAGGIVTFLMSRLIGG